MNTTLKFQFKYNQINNVKYIYLIYHIRGAKEGREGGKKLELEGQERGGKSTP